MEQHGYTHAHARTHTHVARECVSDRDGDRATVSVRLAKVRSRVAMLNFMPPLTHTHTRSRTHTRTVGVCHFAGSQAARHFCVHGDCGRSFCGQNGQRFGILVTLCCLCWLAVSVCVYVCVCSAVVVVLLSVCYDLYWFY